jgi:hypothetical protein
VGLAVILAALTIGAEAASAATIQQLAAAGGKTPSANSATGPAALVPTATCRSR